EAESQPAELDDFLHDAVDGALPRLLAVSAPDGAERTMLRASANRLHRRPHIAAARQQIPSSRYEPIASYSTALVYVLRAPRQAVGDHALPHKVGVALHDRMGTALRMGFFWKERRMNAAEHDPGAPLAELTSNLVPAPGVPRVNPDSDDVAAV